MAEDTKAKDVAMDMAEEARKPRGIPQFHRRNVQRDLRWIILPFPVQSAEDKAIGDELLAKVKDVFETYVDPYVIDRDGEYSREALDKLVEIGLFGTKIPMEYGGLGLSVSNYARVLSMVGKLLRQHGYLSSAHQSIGVPSF